MPRTRRAPASVPALVSRAALAMLLAGALVASLLGGLAGGLLRAGFGAAALPTAAWAGQAVLAHAYLMIGGVIGTVIGVERAVAVRARLGFVAPLASGLAGVLLLFGHAEAARACALGAACAFVAVNAVVVARQPAAHTVLLLIAALAWLGGSALWAFDAPSAAVLAFWFAFLVLTIAAERLEMTRLMRRAASAARSMWIVVATLLTGAGASCVWPAAGGALYGLALFALAIWLLRFDIARRTVKASGLSRYMALCLLLGYGWLAASGVAWVATSAGLAWRDAALHALALGFVFSMMLGHAPVILPAVARIKLLFTRAFYVPLALLHLSLALRVAARGFESAALFALGAAGNVAAIVCFVAIVAASAVAWRRRHAHSSSPHHDHHAAFS